jgi:GH15 family glucan-1,4-alpha-glucosidase
VVPHLERTIDWWRRWTAEITYAGPRVADVRRSLITLRLLTYAPSGAPVAAPTTSLPEVPGGPDNWDYRFSWPRDSALNVMAFAAAGKLAEAEAFFYWALHAVRLTRPRINVLYDVLGGTRVRERELDLPGWEGGRPVRVGNAAAEQFQLDVYGWVLAAASALAAAGGTMWRETLRSLRGHADFVARHWDEPDHGIWELRGGRRHYVQSKAMAWLALRCMADLDRTGGRRSARWLRTSDAIAAETRARGFDPEALSYTVAFGEPTLDAALLLLPWIGMDDPSDPRLAGTVDAVRRTLEVEPGLVFRHLRGPGTGRPGEREGAFVACAFWLAQALEILGRRDEAIGVYEAAAGRVNDVGLLSEEIEAGSGRFLGNFPQALSHASLVLAALALDGHEPGITATGRRPG